MNNRQLVAMWLGIAIIILVAYLNFEGWRRSDVADILRFLGRFLTAEIVVAAVTCGLVATLADKKRNRPKDE